MTMASQICQSKNAARTYFHLNRSVSAILFGPVEPLYLTRARTQDFSSSLENVAFYGKGDIRKNDAAPTTTVNNPSSMKLYSSRGGPRAAEPTYIQPRPS